MQQAPHSFHAMKSYRHQPSSFLWSTWAYELRHSSVLGTRGGRLQSKFARLATYLAEPLRLAVRAHLSPNLSLCVPSIDAPITPVYSLLSVFTISSFLVKHHADDFPQRTDYTVKRLQKVFCCSRHLSFYHSLIWGFFHHLDAVFDHFCTAIVLIRDAGRRFSHAMACSPCTEYRTKNSRDRTQGSTDYMPIANICEHTCREQVLRSSLCPCYGSYGFYTSLPLSRASHYSLLSPPSEL